MITTLLAATSTQVVDLAGKTSQITGITTLGRLIEIGASAILIVGGLAFLLYLLMGGFTWITAGGDKSKVESARNMITQGIIGIAILASVFALYGVILRFFGIKGISLGAGGGGGTTTSDCSDYCAGTTLTGSQYHPDQCENQGGHQVSRRCSGGACAGNTYPCLIP